MSGDTTQTLTRRADASNFDEHAFRRAFELDPLLSPPASAGTEDTEFWGFERKEVLTSARRRRLRQAFVVCAMVLLLGGLLILVDRAESQGGGSTVASEAAATQPPVAPEVDATAAQGSEMQSSSVGEAPSLEPLRSLSKTESPIAGFAETFRRPTQSTEAPQPAPSTTAVPTTAAPTTVEPTTTAPATTTTDPTTTESVAPSTVPATSMPLAEEPATPDAAEAGTPDDTSPDTTVVDEPAPTTTEVPTEPAHPEGWVDAGHGVFVPAVLIEIRFCESTNNYTAANKWSSARGAYQFIRGSWAAYGHRDRYGVAEAHLATPAQQDEAALLTWQQSGTRPWNASKHCWG